MCDRCAELERRIEELEDAVHERLALPVLLHQRMHVSPSQAYLLAALYRRKGGAWMSRLELDAEIPRVHNAKGFADEFRTLNGVSVLVWQIRKRLNDRKVIESCAGTLGGYRLSERGRKLVAEALA